LETGDDRSFQVKMKEEDRRMKELDRDMKELDVRLAEIALERLRLERA
jgi:hypothetical protein